MKKITFSIMALALAAMMFTGCKKENAATQEPEKQAEKTAMTFYAVPQGGERTGLDGALNSIWTEGDQIKIFTEATIATGGDVFTLSKGAGTDYGEFTGESVEGLEYLGVYPASSFYISTTYIGLEFDMPSTQTYVENSYASNTVPLFAGSESKNLTFENLSGLLRVGIKVTSPTTVTSMVLKDKNSNAKLWGKYVVVLYQISRVSAYLGQGGASLTMDLGDGVALNTSTYTYFFFSVPALTEPGNVQALSSGFTIEMEDADGKTAIIDYTGTDKKVEQGKGKTLEVDDVEFKASSSTTGTAKRTGDIDVKWVQLWENGPKWAEYNVGEDTGSGSYGCGGYFAWKGNVTRGTQETVDDTATDLWGSNWRMPTQEEFYNLLDKCTAEWTTVSGKNGRLYTGKGDYSGNSVFFPAAGYYFDEVHDAGSYGCYWSSTSYGSYGASTLYFYSGDQTDSSEIRDNGLSVRAVLNE
ncbi:MAG: DUF1566 domain-containing protein [Paludibacteraceae bacterium]|nr:DUF1566 domain-containing protein [Paludibacteraceae bacterium]